MNIRNTICAFLWLVVWLSFPVPAHADTHDIRAKDLLVSAMRARDEKKIGLARLFFLQARKIYPPTPKPVWLRDFPDPASEAEEQKLFLRLCDSFPEFDCEVLLRERLRLLPENQEVRSRLLQIARKKGNETEILRHTSMLERPFGSWFWLKRLVAVLIYALIIYNLWLLIKSKRN